MSEKQLHFASAVASYAAAASDSGDQDELKPWERSGWVPTLKSGKQKSPNMVRNELQRYIDECKANKTSTQTQILETMGINSNTFRRFMNPKTYKNQWSATDNGCYWAGARLLERVKYEKEIAKKAAKKSGKRKASDGETSATSASAKKSKPSKAELKQQVAELIDRVNNVPGVSANDGVYDSCPHLVSKIKVFLQRDGMTKAALLEALGGVNSNSLNRFLSAKNQDQCQNIVYKAGYTFFERLRILEEKPKSNARLKNEKKYPNGFDLRRRTHMWVFTGRP